MQAIFAVSVAGCEPVRSCAWVCMDACADRVGYECALFATLRANRSCPVYQLAVRLVLRMSGFASFIRWPVRFDWSVFVFPFARMLFRPGPYASPLICHPVTFVRCNSLCALLFTNICWQIERVKWHFYDRCPLMSCMRGLNYP